jgi:ribosomal protein S18 acetylase RimI-like enzyme
VRSSFPADHRLEALVWQDRSAAVWLAHGSSDDHRPWLYAAGSPAGLAELLTIAGPAWLNASGITVDRDALSVLPEQWQPERFDDWDWWSTRTPPPHHELESSVQPLEDGDAAIIKAFLDVASPDHWAPPAHPLVRRWWGIWRDDRLVCCACETRPVADVPHVASVATAHEHRGEGLARATVGALTRQLMAEGAPMVTLGSHAHNRSAAAVYQSLGFKVRHRWRSGRLTDTPHGSRQH